MAGGGFASLRAAVEDYNSRRAPRQNAGRPRRAVSAPPAGKCSPAAPWPSPAAGMAATECPPVAERWGGCWTLCGALRPIECPGAAGGLGGDWGRAVGAGGDSLGATEGGWGKGSVRRQGGGPGPVRRAPRWQWSRGEHGHVLPGAEAQDAA